MPNRLSTAVLALLLLIYGAETAAQAQWWRWGRPRTPPSNPLIASSRRIDWSTAGVPGGIPVRTTICSTLSAGATAAAITAAIGACPAGQVVKLNAGTYALADGVRFNAKSNVTLRGSGPDQTFLVFSGTTNCMGMGGDICVNGTDLGYYVESPAHVAEWSGGYSQGATELTFSNTTGLSVGMYVVLDQLNDSTDTGQVLVCSVNTTCAAQGPGGSGRTNREQQQFVRVTAINGLAITITPSLHMPNWRSAQTPQAFWGSATSMITGAGVEDLSLDHTAATFAKSGIFVIFASNSWVKNVRSLKSNRNHVWLYESAHITVRDSYFYDTQNGSSQSYGIEEFMASDNLIENNILHHIAAPLQTNTGTGSVFAYNYTFDDYYNFPPDFQQSSSYLHGAGTDMILHEGNQGTGFTGDNVHGSHNFVTAFRNYWNGREPGKATQTEPVILYSFNRYMNFIGNVLGTASYHDTYECDTVSCTSPYTSIWALGLANPTAPSDALVKTTLLRWGNYDTVSGAARFVAGEVPSSLSPHGSPVPGQALPPSLYLSAKPSWWGAIVPWPAIGPDVSGGTGPGGKTYDIPAKRCYVNGAKDGNGVLTAFNAAACYAS